MIITSTTPSQVPPSLRGRKGREGEAIRYHGVACTAAHPALGRFFRPRAVKQVVPVEREKGREKNKGEEDGRETGGKIIARNERREERREARRSR